MGAVISFLVIAIVVLLILSSCIRIVPQAQALVVERLGAYLETWSVGVHFKVPFIDRVAKRVILKEQVVDFAPQPVITKDNVTMKIDTVVFFQITDPKLFAYGVENPIMAIENLTATTLRNIIGDLELDQTLTSRETINTKMRAALDVATDPWGIKVNRVELKNIIPPAAIQDAMEKQMKAERERRESILRAEGEKKSTILVAEGKKESAILEAEAEKEAEKRREQWPWNPDAEAPKDPETERMNQVAEKIRTYIRENYMNEISMQDAARQFNYSDAYFCKLFKQCFDQNFTAYLARFRINEARRLLQDKNASVREVSMLVGYYDANYFAKVFKRIAGMNPSEYRDSFHTDSV